MVESLRVVPLRGIKRAEPRTIPHFLLIGPYDPKGGEFTFLAPPLGVWRLAGVLSAAGVEAQVFDPNCCEEAPEAALDRKLAEHHWDVVGVSTTGMTLQYDLSLAHRVRAKLPRALIVAGGMEATFDPETILRLGPFDLAILGEGEEPLLELAERLRSGSDLSGVAGTAVRGPGGAICLSHRRALNREALREAIFQTPYEAMPYRAYWNRLERSYRVSAMPAKAEREARLAELRSVRLITLNYCPMGCTFCSSTNFLNAAQGDATAKIARLDEHECLSMIARIVSAHPDLRTVIFQDDIFVFRNDSRVLALCDGIVQAKASGKLPQGLQFISTNRIDAMTPERLHALGQAGFRVLGFGVESFALDILREFNKAQIYPFITPILREALRLGITPFLDMILTSPHCQIADLAENIRQAFMWIEAGCEVGMYPYVIPFSGSAMASNPALRSHTVFAHRHVAGTDVAWQQASKILPIDPHVRQTILEIECEFNVWIARLSSLISHLPSRVRSLVWVLSAVPSLRRAGFSMPPPASVFAALRANLPGITAQEEGWLQREFQLRRAS